MDLVGHFQGLLSRIEPDQADVSKAKKSHELLRETLRKDEEVGKAHLDTYLSGSYARHTAINNIKDVDVICVLDIDTNVTEPTVLLRWLETALIKYYGDVRPQGRSIGITTSDGFCLDVVPGTPQIEGAVDGPIWIPDRDAKLWVGTHPKGQIKFSEDRNFRTDGFYVQVVKMAKHWRDRLPSVQARPKSYIVETLVAETMGASAPASHAGAALKVLDGIWARYGSWVGTGRVPTITDPGYATVNVAKRWQAAEFDAFMTHVRASATIARQAYEETDQGRAVAAWRRLFGNEFAPIG